MAELDVFPHNLAAGSPLIVGDLVYASTGTGVDEAHINVPMPYAPSLVALDKKTGELVWDDATPDEKVLHGTWSNPSYAVIDGRAQVIFPAGDGWVYSFEPKTGKILWKFDANPKDSVWKLGGAGTKNNIIAMGVIYDDKVYVGVGQDPEHGEAPGHFYAIDPTLEGDVTAKAKVWHRSGEDFRRTISSAAIKDDIVYISDLSGFLYALERPDRRALLDLRHLRRGLGLALRRRRQGLSGGRGRRRGGAGRGQGQGRRTGHPRRGQNMGAATYTTPVAHDGTLFVLSRNRLFALAEGAGMKPAADKPASR